MSIFLLIFPLWLNAQNFKHDDSKILDLPNKISENLFIVRKDNPLKGKKFGVELDIPFLIYSLFATESFVYNAGFSYFDTKNKNEYALPFIYYGYLEDKVFRINGHFRKYVGNTLKGFYIGGFAAISFVQFKGEYYAVNYGNARNPSNDIRIYSIPPSTDTKFGIGVEIGGKIISYKGWYWGWNLGIGKYIISNDIVKGFLMFDNNLILDSELLKLGYAF